MLKKVHIFLNHALHFATSEQNSCPDLCTLAEPWRPVGQIPAITTSVFAAVIAGAFLAASGNTEGTKVWKVRALNVPASTTVHQQAEQACWGRVCSTKPSFSGARAACVVLTSPVIYRPRALFSKSHSKETTAHVERETLTRDDGLYWIWHWLAVFVIRRDGRGWLSFCLIFLKHGSM